MQGENARVSGACGLLARRYGAQGSSAAAMHVGMAWGRGSTLLALLSKSSLAARWQPQDLHEYPGPERNCRNRRPIAPVTLLPTCRRARSPAAGTLSFCLVRRT